MELEYITRHTRYRPDMYQPPFMAYAIGDMTLTRSGMVIIDHGCMAGMPGSGMHETIKAGRYDDIYAHTTAGLSHQSVHMDSNLNESLFNDPNDNVRRFGVF